jgi:hypothetical protein
MADNFLNPMKLFREVSINVIGGLILGIITGFFTGQFWIGISASALVVLFFFGWLWKKYERMIKLVVSGNAGYYFSFDLEENPKVWQEVKKSFCYLGVSSDSILEQLRGWIENNTLTSYRILLMKPDSESLMRQEAFQIGHDINTEWEELSADARQAIEQAADATTKRINSAVSVLKNTASFKNGWMELKLYDEFIPWWMYVLDERKAYIGILERGRRGYESPVMVMKKNDMYTSPFDAFKNNYERLWEKAERVV